MSIHQQIRDSIRPQLAQLRDLEKQHKHHARLERARRDYQIWDATNEELECQLTRSAFRAVGATFTTAYKEVECAVETIFNAVKDAVTPIYEEVAAGYAAQNRQNRVPADPVPATGTSTHQDQ